MVVLSFLENIKDKASRVLPTPYMDSIEEATQPHLVRPAYDDVSFLCDRADSNPDFPVDIVRAIRRRIKNEDPKVQYLVVELLSEIIKICGISLHLEMASQKGLLRDLQVIATRHPCITQTERQSREAALTLILNLSIWFAGHPDGRLYILTTIADDVRHESGPNVFEGIFPDTSTQINFYNRSSRRAHRTSGVRSTRPNPKEPQGPIVDAIGICFPKEDELNSMLDACATLAEYIDNLKVNDDGSITLDDIIQGFRTKIREDHRLVTVLLSSDLKSDNRDTLRDIMESQRALLRRLDSEAHHVSPPLNVEPAAQLPNAPSGIAQTENTAPQVAMDTANKVTLMSSDISGANPPMLIVEPTSTPQQDHQPQQEQSNFADLGPREVSKPAEAVVDTAADNVMDVFQGLSAPPMVPLREPCEEHCEVVPTNPPQEEQQQQQQPPVEQADDTVNQPVSYDDACTGDDGGDGAAKAQEHEEQNEKSENVEEVGRVATQRGSEDDDFDAFIESQLAK